MRVGIIFINIGPYHLERARATAQSLRAKGYQLILIELTANTLNHPWQIQRKEDEFQWITLLESSTNYQKSKHSLILKMHECLKKLQIDILAIAGYSDLIMLSALLWCTWHRKPAILLSESQENDAPRSWWQETIKSWILKGCKAALVGGKPHKRYLIKLGMIPDSIFLGYDVVGNAALHPIQIRHLPKPLERPYFLAISRFIPKKNLLMLLSSYTTYRQIGGDNTWDLVLCGEGSLRPQIEQYIAEHGLKNCVHLPGFLTQDELLSYFTHASCFIHASIQEQWGLVVNEAMAAGLPVLVSNRCGCFEDLVIEGVNGFGFDPENSQQLTDFMLKVSSGEVDLAKMGHAALEHIQKFSPDYFGQGLMQAVEYALAHR
jgi:glycosyltransferase involved in cell wall biosynthesis